MQARKRRLGETDWDWGQSGPIQWDLGLGRMKGNEEKVGHTLQSPFGLTSVSFAASTCSCQTSISSAFQKQTTPAVLQGAFMPPPSLLFWDFQLFELNSYWILWLSGVQMPIVDSLASNPTSPST